jgi:hypothetical protein
MFATSYAGELLKSPLPDALSVIRRAPCYATTVLASSKLARRAISIWIAALSALAIACWIFLYRWYSLAEHYEVQYFAFEKIPGHFSSPVLRWTALLFLTISGCYCLSYWILQTVARFSTQIKCSIILLISAVVIVNVLLYPVGALDVYNYVVELKLALFYQQNPYLTTFMAYNSDPAGKFAFFNHVPLFYGPLWLFLSGLPTLITGFEDTQRVVVGLKVENVVLLAATAIMLYCYQADARGGWIAVYLFAANPLVIFEVVGNAHNDMLLTAFVVAAVLALRQQSRLAAPLLLLSAMVKLFSAALVPLFMVEMLRARWRKPTIVASWLAALVLPVALAAPLWADGRMLSGLSEGITVAQSLNYESLFSLTREYLRLGGHAPDTEAAVQYAFVALFGASVLVVAFALWRGRRLEPALIDAFLLFAVLISLLTPWYLLPALTLIAMRGDAAQVAYLLVATTLGLLYYPLYVWAWFDSGMAAFQVHLFLAAFLVLPIVVLLLTEAATWRAYAKKK